MKNKHFHYSISGYRWAPESFRASKRIASQPPQTIPLSFEERYEVGMLALTKGPETAIGCVKHIERARERQRRQIITYGFRAKESTRQLVYCPQLYCPSDAAIGERLRLFKEIRNFLRKNGGRVVVSTECDLDGEYRPVNVRENAITADFSRPMRISMGEKAFHSGPDRPNVPWQGPPRETKTTGSRSRSGRGR